jgi:hypothetical protein
LTKCLEYLIIVTKNTIPPSLFPKAIWRCQKHNTLMKILTFIINK